MTFDSGTGELLSRYISDAGQIRNSDNTVRHNAFMPSKTARLSVYWISGLQEKTIWHIGDTYVAPNRGRIVARAELNSLVVYEDQLSVEVTGTPHPRHADIIGWDLSSDKRRLQAMKLANSAALRRVSTL